MNHKARTQQELNWSDTATSEESSLRHIQLAQAYALAYIGEVLETLPERIIETLVTTVAEKAAEEETNDS